MSTRETNATNNKKRSSDVEIAGRVAKRPSPKIDESTCVLVIGGKEFHENRGLLRYWSGYFDGAFRSGMIESQTGRFEFPNRDPKEWKIMKDILNPFSPVVVTGHNVGMVLSWSDELCMNHCIPACESALLQQLDVYPRKRPACVAVVGNLDLAFRHNLSKVKTKCIDVLQDMLQSPRYRFLLNHVKWMLKITVQYDTHEGADKLWGMLVERLPKEVQNMEKKVLVSNPLLPSLVLAGLPGSKEENRITTREQSLITYLSDLSERFGED